MSYTLNVELENEFSAFLYPNQYVNFNKDTKAVGIAKELVKSAKSDLEAVEIIFNYVVDTIEYDYDKAKTVKSGYLPNVDEILQLKKGICFDYSAVMATMLRTQKIPTIMEIGYANEIYHAWISVYTKEKGWISGIIQFDGYNWKIVDPTFADGDNKSEKIKSFINNSSNYSVEFKF
ncbi:MAG: transglutaminase-like domain-containing protein [Oscillospiraceae bacterium]